MYCRGQSVTALFGVLQERICYSIVWGTAGADLLRNCLVYFRSGSVTALFGYCRSPSDTALFGVLQEPICYSIVWCSSGEVRNEVPSYAQGFPALESSQSVDAHRGQHMNEMRSSGNKPGVYYSCPAEIQAIQPDHLS